MKKLDIEFITRLSFQYDLRHKNFGMVNQDEPFDLFYEGTITKLRTDTGGYPETIGMFVLNIANLGTAKLFDVKDDLIESLEFRSNQKDDSSYGMQTLIHDKRVGLTEKDKIIFLKNVVILPQYRNMGVFEELIKSIYMTHYSPNSMFVLAGKPVQSIKGEMEFLSDLTLDVWNDEVVSPKKVVVNVGEYFQLDTLPTDDEMNDYKLYAKFQSINLKQYKNSPFFYYENYMDFWTFMESYVNRFKVLN